MLKDKDFKGSMFGYLVVVSFLKYSTTDLLQICNGSDLHGSLVQILAVRKDFTQEMVQNQSSVSLVISFFTLLDQL